MNKWRIYRLPGDRQWWRIDSGQGTAVLFCNHWSSTEPMFSRDLPRSNDMPRAWIEVTAYAWLPEGILRSAEKSLEDWTRVVEFLSQIPNREIISGEKK